MSLSGSVSIAGVFEHPTRFAPDKTELQIMAESARGALEDCGLALADVDGLASAGIAMGAMGVVALAEYLNLKPRWIDGTNIGGSSFLAHVAHGADAVVTLRKARAWTLGLAIHICASLIVPPIVSGATPTLEARFTRSFSRSVSGGSLRSLRFAPTAA